MTFRIAVVVFVAGMAVSGFGSEQDRFVESFDGNGEFGAENDLGPATGLDNPGWVIPRTATLVDGGLRLPTDELSNQGVWRRVEGSSSFRNEVHLKDVVLDGDDGAISAPLILLNHTPGIDEGNSALGRLSIGVAVERSAAPSVFVETGGRLPSESRIFYDVAERSLFEVGTDVMLAVEFEEESLDAFFEYDLNTRDAVAATRLGPFMYEGEVTDIQNTTFDLSRGFEQTNTAFGILDSWSLSDLVRVPGDFDGDGSLTSTDIEMLSAEVLLGTNESAFDLNDDDLVDAQDRRFWVQDLAQTSFGDANLDGSFDSRDFVSVFQAAEYEDSIAKNSGWDEGDWSGDGEFDSADFVVAFQGGTYERGEVAANVLVPEPTSTLVWLLLPFIAFRFKMLSR
ncbi:dockerin type I domain-containing protein [Planctomycetota bacterium]